MAQAEHIFYFFTGSRVRFTLPSSSSSGSLAGFMNPPFPGEFHRSASSPHSLFILGSDSGFQFSNVTSSRSDENIAEQRSGSNTSFTQALNSYENASSENASRKETRLLTEVYNRALIHLVHVVCRAQTHCSRDLLWRRLLVGGTGEEEKDGGRKGRRKSEVRRSESDYSLKNWMKGLDSYSGAEKVAEIGLCVCLNSLSGQTYCADCIASEIYLYLTLTLLAYSDSKVLIFRRRHPV